MVKENVGTVVNYVMGKIVINVLDQRSLERIREQNQEND
jgi:hypothetical protein